MAKYWHSERHSQVLALRASQPGIGIQSIMARYWHSEH